MHEPFSLLVPVYDGDRTDYLRRAFRSAVDDQTVRPDQVIIVRDEEGGYFFAIPIPNDAK